VLGYGSMNAEVLMEGLLGLRRLFPASGPVRFARGGSPSAVVSR